MAARVLPIAALFIFGLLYLYPDPTYIQMFWCGVATVSLTSAVVWWWWIMDTVKKFFNLVEKQVEKFGEVKEEIQQVKKDLNDVKKNSGSRKRTQSKES